jgi:hypothetical protein
MKKNPSPNLALLFACVTAATATTGHSQVLFSDDFDTDHSANWQVSLSHADAFSDVFFDYSTIGVPSAPNSTGGSTRGLRFIVNQSAGVFQGISASPVGQSFSGDFSLRFDMWLNYVGPLGPGGSGTTQMATFGIGANGTSVQWAGASSSLLFGATLDGGSASDYRSYAGGTNVTDLTVYAAGSQNQSASYYVSAFPGQTAPAAQTGLYAGQTGTTLDGSVGFAWRDVEIKKEGGTVTYSIDNTVIATIGFADSLALSTNIVLGMFDTTAGSSTDPNDFLNAAIFDNVRVTGVPEPATVGLVAVGLGALLLKARRKQG